jgi:hypothetical protein
VTFMQYVVAALGCAGGATKPQLAPVSDLINF